MQDKIRTYVKVSCPCGNAVRIDPMSEVRSLRCPVCSYQISFVVTVDRATKRPKVSIVVPPDAIKSDAGESLGVASRHSSKAAAPPPPEPPAPRPQAVTRGVFGTCPCGAEFQVDEVELTTIQACPRCAVKYHVVVKMDRATKARSAILVPVEGAQPLKPRPLSPAVVKTTRAVKRPAPPEKTRVKPAKPAPVIPPGAQAVKCSCGEILVVRKRDVVAGLTCGECGKALRLMEDRDPQTLAPRIRVRPDPKK